MSDIEDDLRRFQEQQAERQANLDAQKEAFRDREQSEIPQEERAQQAWDKLKAETELTPEQQNATAEEQANWHRQENDPRQGQGNAYTAQEQSAQHAQDTDLKQHSMPEMTADEKAAVMEEISNNLESLTQELLQQEQQTQSYQQDIQVQR